MKKHNVLAIMQIITGVGIILFWVGFFTAGMAPKNPPECYFAFEHAFPLPDGILCMGLIVAGILLLKQKPAGRTLSLICSGGLMFLGVIDFSFNIQNGMYFMELGESIGNACINALCMGLGLTVAIRLGREG